MKSSGTDRREELASALNHLRLAIELLDTSGAPAHIGAHVDLAIHQLQEELEGELKASRSD